MTDFIITREAAVAQNACEDGLEWATPFLPCKFTDLVQRAITREELGRCVWALRLDTGPDADKRIVMFALSCARGVEHHAVGYPAAKACNDMIQRWLDGERISYSQLLGTAKDLYAAAVANANPYAARAAVYAAANAAYTAAYTAANAGYAAAVCAASAATDASCAAGSRDEQRKFLLELYTEVQ